MMTKEKTQEGGALVLVNRLYFLVKAREKTMPMAMMMTPTPTMITTVVRKRKIPPAKRNQKRRKRRLFLHRESHPAPRHFVEI